jgi:ABC-type uncharacterized transport system ATPase subunit
VISAEDLTKVYGKRTALDHVSFEVPEGEIFGFVPTERRERGGPGGGSQEASF